MKILFVVQNYYPSVGGTQTLFQNIAERFANDYHDKVDVFTINSYYSPHHEIYKKINTSCEQINGVNIHRFPFIRLHLTLFRWLSMLSKKVFKKDIPFVNEYIMGPVSRQLKQAIANTNADVIIASSSVYTYMNYPLWRKKTNNPKPFIFHGAIHFTSNKKQEYLPQKLISSIKASDCYVANTVYEKQRLVALGVRSENIAVIDIGIDVNKYRNINANSFRQQYKINSDDIIVTYIGRIEPIKGIDVLIAAVKLALQQQNKITLVIAGYESNYAEKLKKIIDQMNALHHRVILLTSVTEDHKYELLTASDMLVLPSVNESFGIVFLEAWVCKKPVIGINIGAISSVVKDGVDGLLAKPLDANDLAEKILLLANDVPLRISMGEKGYNKVIANYSWKKIIETYRDVCLKAIKNFPV
ncbi:MAG: glycosyltransferase family 4 protein [Parafilimonas sp.]